jgi:cytosine/adenosine deaminase-related metal-dependent hydrolase
MILSARWIVPVSSAPLDDAAVVVDHDRISDIGPLDIIREKYPNHPSRHFPNSVLLPGLVNAHSHLELTVLRGYLEGLDFWSWIRKLTWTKYKVLNREDLLNSALLGTVEAIRSGITTLADPMDVGTSLEAVLKAGLRGILYQEVFSPSSVEADAAFELLTSKLDALKLQVEQYRAKCPRVALGVSPHAPYTVSGALFQKVDALAKSKGLRTCIHVAESDAETRLLQDGSGPIGESYRERGIVWTPPCCTPVEYLESLQVLSPTTLLVHCIRLSPSDYEVLHDREVSVAHCPKSNWKLGHGSMDLRSMRRHGIRLGLGSDSVASNNVLDLFEEMRFLLANPSFYVGGRSSDNERLSSTDALRIATLGGAEALGISEVTGSLQPGKQADIIAVDLSKAHAQPVFSPIDALVYSARASDVHFTMVAGDILFEQDRIATISESELYSRIERVREKLLDSRTEN